MTNIGSVNGNLMARGMHSNPREKASHKKEMGQILNSEKPDGMIGANALTKKQKAQVSNRAFKSTVTAFFSGKTKLGHLKETYIEKKAQKMESTQAHQWGDQSLQALKILENNVMNGKEKVENFFEDAKDKLKNCMNEKARNEVMITMQKVASHVRLSLEQQPKLKTFENELLKTCSDIECCIQDIQECGLQILESHEKVHPDLDNSLRELQILQKSIKEKGKEASLSEKKGLVQAVFNAYKEIGNAILSGENEDDIKYSISEIRSAISALSNFNDKLLKPLDGLFTLSYLQMQSKDTLKSMTFDKLGDAFKTLTHLPNEEKSLLINLASESCAFCKSVEEVTIYLRTVTPENFDEAQFLEMLKLANKNKDHDSLIGEKLKTITAIEERLQTGPTKEGKANLSCALFLARGGELDWAADTNKEYNGYCMDPEKLKEEVSKKAGLEWVKNISLP